MAEGRIVEDEAELERIVRGAKTVAVVGMKDERDADAPAHRIPKILVERGLEVTPVNPKIERALGVPALKDLASLPARVDIVDVFRRPETLGALADEILALPAERRPAVVWFQKDISNDEAAGRLAAAGMTVVQDHCLGVYSARYRGRAG